MPSTAPDFLPLSQRQELSLAELAELDEPAVIFEYVQPRDDAPDQYVYTVAGWLHGQNVATQHGGCTVGGEGIAVFADSRGEADEIAVAGLQTTINAIKTEARNAAAAVIALQRLRSAGPAVRLDQMLAPQVDRSSEFMADIALLRAAGLGDAVQTHAHQTGYRR